MLTALAGESVPQAQVNGLVEEVLPQGCWSDDDYLWLTDHTRRLVEFTDGYLEILPMPSRGHQRILAYLYSLFYAFVAPSGGEVLFAPLRLRIRPGKFREPDLLLVRDARDARSGERFWTGADVVVEVVSPDNPQRDLVLKRDDYAEAAIPEYWIVDPATETLTVLKLEDSGYVEHGVYERGARTGSSALPGFEVDVGDVFDAAGSE
ncbi:MAG: Uma2 family endonuclease [Immundisolibacterales bacterium]|nr:Uma2 family endonuclease [Immundisolibacterales bacterium]